MPTVARIPPTYCRHVLFTDTASTAVQRAVHPLHEEILRFSLRSHQDGGSTALRCVRLRLPVDGFCQVAA